MMVSILSWLFWSGFLSINPVLITTKLYVCDLLLLRMFEFRQKEPHRVFVVFFDRVSFPMRHVKLDAPPSRTDHD